MKKGTSGARETRAASHFAPRKSRLAREKIFEIFRKNSKNKFSKFRKFSPDSGPGGPRKINSEGSQFPEEIGPRKNFEKFFEKVFET